MCPLDLSFGRLSANSVFSCEIHGLWSQANLLLFTNLHLSTLAFFLLEKGREISDSLRCSPYSESTHSLLKY